MEIAGFRHSGEMVEPRLEERLNMALAAAKMGVWDWDLHSNAVFWSPEVLDIVGLKEFDGTFNAFAKLLHPDDEARVMATVGRAVAEGENYSDEFRIIRPDGEQRWLFNLGRPTYDENGTPLRLIGTVQDITERKRAEEMHRESEERYRAIVDAFDGYMYICSKDYRIEFMNEKLIQRTGRNATGEYCYNALHDLASVCEWCKNEEFFCGKSARWEVHSPKDGRWYEVSNSPINKINGTVSKQAMITDITVRKQAEKAREEALNLLQNITSRVPGVVYQFRLNPDGSSCFPYANESLRELFNVDPKEVLDDSSKVFAKIHPDDCDGVIASIRESARDLTPCHREYRVKHDDGTVRWMVGDSLPQRNNDGSVIWHGVTTDSTERKLIEEELRLAKVAAESANAVKSQLLFELEVQNKRQREAVESYQMLFREMLDGFALHEIICDERGNPADYRFLAVNPAFEKLTGLKGEEIIGHTVMEILPDTEPHWIETYGNVALTGQPAIFESYAIELNKHFSVSAFQPKRNQFACIFTDITGRKQFELQILLNTTRLKGLVNIHQYRAETIQDFLDFVLNEAINLTESKIGYVYFYNEDRSEFELYSVSRDVTKECLIADRQTCIELEKSGIWGEVVRQRKPIIVNDFPSCNPLLKWYPDGHNHLHKFMTLPIAKEGRIVAVVVVANKDNDYTEADLLQLTLLMESAWNLVEIRRAEEENRKLEAQLHQAQKLESIGNLAGGVAHDFNNKLSVILGHAYMALAESIPDQVRDSLEDIRKAAEQSAELTRQLLAFARKQTIAPKVLDLNETVTGMLKMLNRLIGENIDFVWQPASDLWLLKFDPSQVDQILANLCVNARDAIADDGKIIIQTGNCIIDKDYCVQHEDAVPGEYVRLAVSDNGSGMDTDTLDRIFEPFFTTKETGKGTGLGLATVFGIVKQNNGFIHVNSEPGKGSTFTIYLPRYMGRSVQSQSEGDAMSAPSGLETILLVEDELAILNMTTMLLTRQGYNILQASTPADAIRLAKEHTGEISLLITDVIMPSMNGKDMAHQLQSSYPRLKCLFMSGYTADAIAHHGVLDEGVNFIQKPFSLPVFATKVRDVLDSK